MNVETSQVTKLLIKDIEGLDPISVILEDLGPRQGKINIECYGQAWSAYWGGMGNRTITEFVSSCDQHYLAGNLSGIRSDIDDYEGIPARARREIVQMRKDKEIKSGEARDLFDKAAYIFDREAVECNREFMTDVFGDDWWYSIPTKPNPDYQYLCRIINTVKQALKYPVAKAA